jgi:hypothetical protein
MPDPYFKALSFLTGWYNNNLLFILTACFNEMNPLYSYLLSPVFYSATLYPCPIPERR